MLFNYFSHFLWCLAPFQQRGGAGALSSPPCLPVLGFFLPPTCFEWSGSEGSRSYFTSAWTLAALSLLSKQIVYKRGLYLKKELNVRSCFLALKCCRPAVAFQRVGLCLARSRTGFDARLSRSAWWREGLNIVRKMCSFICPKSLNPSKVGFKIACLSHGSLMDCLGLGKLSFLWCCEWTKLGNEANGRGAFR